MSLLFASSVSRYASADAAQEWTIFQSSWNSIVAGAGRWGGSALRNTLPGSIGGAKIFSKGVNASGPTGVLHFAFKPGDLTKLGAVASNISLVSIWAGGVAQLSVRVTTGGGVAAYRSTSTGATSLGASGGGLLANGVWAQLQIKFKIDATTGTIEIRLNGNPTPILTLTAQNTRGAAGTNWDEVRFTDGGSEAAAHNNDFGEFVFLDGVDATATQGKPYNDFLGDCSVRPHFSSGVGASATWTRGGTDSGANWSQVDEPVANSDTDTVTTPTTGARDLYAMQDLLATGQAISAVVPTAQVKKLDAGFASLGPAFRYGGVNYDPAAGVTPSTNYTFAQMLNGLWVGLHPSGVPWTEANFNATEAGPYKVG